METVHRWIESAACLLVSVLPFAAMIAGIVYGRFHRRRAKLEFAFETDRGLCARCGYDLRSTPDRCPECGTVRNPLTATDQTDPRL